MSITLPKTIPDAKDYFKSPFYKNSFYIALGRFSDVGFGFLFWTLAARLYPVADVGIATALISSLGLVMAFSRLGFDTAIIRFMPSHDPSRVFNTSLGITTVAATMVGIVLLATINIVSPELAFIRAYTPFFLLFAIANSIVLTTGNALLSFRKADLKFIQTFITGVRLPLLLFLTLFGSIGIFYSCGIAYLAAAVFTLVVVRNHITLPPRIDWDFTRKTFYFSSSNYLADLLLNAPLYILPILIVSLLSPEDAALFYIAFAIGNLVLIIPDAMSTSFFVEGSHGINLQKGVLKALAGMYVFLIPATLLIIFSGGFLLSFFGKDYVSAFNLLKVIAASSLFVAIYNLFIPLQNIRLQVRGIVILNLVRFILFVGFSCLFLIRFGVLGVGYAWAITYVMLSIAIVAFAKWKGWV